MSKKPKPVSKKPKPVSKKPKPVSKKPKKIYGRGRGEYEYEADGVTLIVTPLNLWKTNPLINPHDGTDIELSVNPKSEYVKLYKEFINIVIADILLKKKQGYQLTIKDCKNIKDSLPDKHARIKVYGKKDILYDHLFIKYFIKKEKKYNYDEKYKEDIDIYLYLNVYNSIIKKLKPLPRKPISQKPISQKPISQTIGQKSSSDSFGKTGVFYGVIEDLLKKNINMNKADFSICKLIENLCRDIENLFVSKKFKMTREDYNYNIRKKNIEILDYASSIYELCEVTDLSWNKNKMVDFINIKNDSKLIDYIFLEIVLLLIYFDESIHVRSEIKLLKKKSYKEIFIILQKIYEKIDILADILADISNIKYKTIYDHIYKEVKEEDIIQSFIDPLEKEELDKELIEKCGHDWKDGVSLDEIKDLSYNKKKHITYIKYDPKIFCFDTISIYNYIISCIEERKDPDNPFNRVKLTVDDIFTICDNLSKLTVNEEVLLGANLIKFYYYLDANLIKIYYYLDVPVIINDNNVIINDNNINKMKLLLNLLRIR